jgi:GH15 family glucan-1,4-alpha-glucosidase
LRSETDPPLQVLYRIDGAREAPVVERNDLYGYRGSRPVRFGNVAASMIELDSYGYLANCALIYLEHGGEWEPDFWRMIRRVAEFMASNWRRKGSSIWEITPEQDFVASKVMSWVTLDRSLKIADRIGEHGAFEKEWADVRDQIHAEVMDRGWSDRLGSFRQHYGADTVDGALLLIPIMKFLPVDHPKVSATIERVVEHLVVNGFLQRFVASQVPTPGSLPLGEEEGGFLMCSFWLAQVHAMRGEIDEAEAILRRAEAIAGPVGLFAEGVDARNNSFLGNMPLLFSQVEYAKAAIALEERRGK